MFKFKLNWIKKDRTLPRWKLIGLLFIAGCFGFTLALSVQSENYFNVILIVICGILFTKNK
tara:strand:- start:259 stop:441 length:183 start_codon:yes stop_codon:yes gene_type:complete